jgi:hypothetical protein
MNEHLRRTADWLTTTVARARAIVDPPLEADARPIEVRARLLDDIEALAEPSGGGRRIFPYAELIVTLVADDDERQAALATAVGDLQADVRRRLDELRCERRVPVAVTIEYVVEPPASWTPAQRFAIVGRPPGAAAPDVPARAAVEVNVLRGTAAADNYTLTGTHICIGRTPAPIDDRGQVRQNHVVFVDGDELSATVGRAHASIRYDADRREYRLFDDGSANGTRIMRRGAVMNVAPRDPMGVALISGDEILLGRAAVRVTLVTGPLPRTL